MRFTIHTKLLLLFATIAIAPLVIVGLASYYNSIQSIEAVLEQRTKIEVDKTAAELEALFAHRLSEFGLLARNREIQSLYASPAVHRASLKQVDGFFEQFFSGSRRIFAQVVYFDMGGVPIFAYGRGSGDGLAASRYDFIARKNIAPSHITLSSYPTDEISIDNLHNNSHSSLVRLGCWVKNLKTGERIGYVLADLSVSNLLKKYTDIFPTETSEYLLIAERQHNNLIFYPQTHRIGQPIDLLLPNFAPALVRLKQNSDGWERFSNDEQEWLVSYANIAAIDWTIAILSQPSTFTAPVRNAGLFNLAITFAAVLLALVLVPWTINRITRSIRKVTEGAEAIAAGNLDQYIEVDSRDETRLLADSFNRMSASLKNTMVDLQALTEELEDRVERRTAQLAESNAQLEQTNTQLAAANQEIQQATQRKSAFLASMSHDLRTPMNAIIGYTRILLRKAEDKLEPRLYKNLGNIEVSSNNLLSLINEILDLSRVESGRVEIKPTDVDLQQLAEECATSVEPLVKKNVELKRDLVGVSVVHTDGELMRRVVMNLLGNAVKFTEAGSITLSVQAVDGGVAVAVADTGVGIPPEDLPYIFEEFRQVDRDGAEAQGSGLGLAIVKKTVELLGGSIQAKSELGQGTAFVIRINNYTA